jgi:hypothetical protein
MAISRFCTLFLFCVLPLLAIPLLHAQNTTDFAAEWDTKQSIARMNAELSQLKPILEEIDPKSWRNSSAGDIYVNELEGLKQQVTGLEWSFGNLLNKPEKLTFVLDSFLRLNAFQRKMLAFSKAIRQYHNPAIAELLESLTAQGSVNQQGLETYLKDLAELKETELRIMDEEAQRCRSQRIGGKR